MSNRYFLDRLALAYILVCFPTASVLLQLHRQTAVHLGRLHWLAYWLIDALCFLEAWRLINWGENSRLYQGSEWCRKLVAPFALVFSLAVGNMLFPFMIEGNTAVPGVVIFLFIVLGFVVGAIGFIGTREQRRVEDRSLTQMKRIHKGCLAVFAGIASLAGVASAWEVVRRFYVETVGDAFLIFGTIFIGASFLVTLLLYPWLLVRSMENILEQQKPPSVDGGAPRAAG